MAGKKIYLSNIISFVISFQCVLCILFIIFRIVFIYYYVDVELIKNQYMGFVNDLWLSIRLDLKTVSIVCLSILFISLLLLFVSEKLSDSIKIINIILSCIILFVVIILSLVNVYYYKVFGNHIDYFVFDFLNPGNFKNILVTVWLDYPVIYLTITFFVIFFISLILLNRMRKMILDIMFKGILIGHPFNKPISSGPYQRTSFNSSVALQLKKLGYKTVFVTSGRKHYHNFNDFYTKQGFDDIYDEVSIRNSNNEAHGGRAWGIWDQYTFDFVQQLLFKSTDQPLFISILTATNHSPFEIPGDYIAYPIDVSELKSAALLKNEKKLTKILISFQYANHMLGNMLTFIKNHKMLSENTMVVVTGDHYIRHVFDYSASHNAILNKYRVPLYIYLPKILKPGKSVDLSRYGSHKDIFSTVFSRIFHDDVYIGIGNDLFSETNNDDLYWARNSEFAMNASGAIHYQGDQTHFYGWNQQRDRLVLSNLRINNDVKLLDKKYHAYNKLYYQLFHQVHE